MRYRNDGKDVVILGGYMESDRAAPSLSIQPGETVEIGEGYAKAHDLAKIPGLCEATKAPPAAAPLESKPPPEPTEDEKMNAELLAALKAANPDAAPAQ